MEPSSKVGAGAEEIRASIQNINIVFGDIYEAQEELSRTVGSVNENLQQVTYSSENALQDTKGVRDSIGTLQRTMSKFSV